MVGRRTRVVAWTLVAAWMLVIFLLSAQPSEASAELSGAGLRVLESIVDALASALGLAGPSAETLDLLHKPLRKLGHLLGYLVLGWLTARATHLTGWARPALVAWLIATGYAASDELHQALVPGRSAEVTDVLLDSVGALIGVWLYVRFTELPSVHGTNSVRHRDQPQRLDRG